MVISKRRWCQLILVFYLSVSELEKNDLADIPAVGESRLKAEKRKMDYDEYEKIMLPIKIVFFNGLLYKVDYLTDDYFSEEVISSLSVSSKQVVVAPVVNINSFDDYDKFTDGSIILSRNMSPNLAIIIRKAKGLISQSGSALSHISIIARESCIPCIVQAEINCEIKDGQYVELNGVTGEIKILDKYLPIEDQSNNESESIVSKQLHAEINEDRR